MVKKTRMITATAMGVLALVSLFLDPLFVTVVVALITLGLFEFFTMLERKGIPIYKYFGTTIGIIIPSSIFFRFELTRGWEFLFISLALGTLFVLQFSRRENTNAVLAISSTLFALFYISWFFSFMIKLKIMPNGTQLVGFLLLVTKGADIGAFFVGRRFGRRALIPHISPKKTVEGALGGMAAAVAAALASSVFLPKISAFSWHNLIILGCALGALGMLGDLSESLIKRDCEAKDSGTILPGMGGVMDVIDSLLFTAPAFYFYMNYYMSRTFVCGTGF
ncbi:MAG: phosphatidate cytidylyltransferase [Deltaproteobacteria bacterium]